MWTRHADGTGAYHIISVGVTHAMTALVMQNFRGEFYGIFGSMQTELVPTIDEAEQLCAGLIVKFAEGLLDIARPRKLEKEMAQHLLLWVGEERDGDQGYLFPVEYLPVIEEALGDPDSSYEVIKPYEDLDHEEVHVFDTIRLMHHLCRQLGIKGDS